MPAHINSIVSKKQLKVKGKHNRILQVHHIAARPLTDREVKILGKFDDMNECRPRITELTQMIPPRLEECGTVKCVVTKKQVRQTRLIFEMPGEIQKELF